MAKVVKPPPAGQGWIEDACVVLTELRDKLIRGEITDAEAFRNEVSGVTRLLEFAEEEWEQV